MSTTFANTQSGWASPLVFQYWPVLLLHSLMAFVILSNGCPLPQLVRVATTFFVGSFRGVATSPASRFIGSALDGGGLEMRTSSLAKLPFFLFLGRPLFLIGLKNDCILESPAASLSSSVRQPFFAGAMVAVAAPT